MRTIYRALLITLLVVAYQTISNAQFPKLTYEFTNLKFPTLTATNMYQHNKTKEIYVAGNGNIYKLNKSDDTWMLVDADPDSNIYPNAKIITMCIDDADVFYAGCTEATYSWISTNGGKKWKPIKDPLFYEPNQVDNLRITKFIKHPNGTVFAATGRKIIMTTDHGRSWQELPNSPTFANVLKIDPKGNLWAAATSGVFFSSDLGNTWVDKAKDLPFYLTDDIDFDSNGNIVVGKHQELFRSTDGGNTWKGLREKFTSNPVGNPLFVEVHFDFNNYLYVYPYYYGYSLCMSKDLGESWYIIAATTNQYGYNISDCVFEGDFIYGINGKTSVYNSYVYKGKEVKTEIEIDKEKFPNSFHLYQNYPNPFNPSTKIQYQLNEPCYVELRIFNLLGEEIAQIQNGYQSVGKHTYDFDAKRYGMSSGIYFYQLKTGRSVESKMMVLME